MSFKLRRQKNRIEWLNDLERLREPITDLGDQRTNVEQGGHMSIERER